MLSDFLFDVLLLRQGRRVAETAAHMHALPLDGDECVDSWTVSPQCVPCCPGRV